MDIERFNAACVAAEIAEQAAGGIGTLGERTLHMVLKRYFEPDENCHEIRIGGFVADIMTPAGIIEIQTRALNKLSKKLAFFLEKGPVTVVYPVAAIKRLRWIDMETGEISPPRKSPRKGQLLDVLPELYGIRQFVTHPDFTLCVIMLEIEEHRYKNGWGKDGKKGSERCDRFPKTLLAEEYFSSAEDYRKMLPEGLPKPFTKKDFSKHSKLTPYRSWFALKTLCETGAIKQTGMEKRAFLYE